MTQETYDKINSLLPAEAIPALEGYIADHPYDDRAFTLRGMKFWAMGRRAEAIHDYHTALRINPDSESRAALTMANEILNFYNKDLLNP